MWCGNSFRNDYRHSGENHPVPNLFRSSSVPKRNTLNGLAWSFHFVNQVAIDIFRVSYYRALGFITLNPPSISVFNNGHPASSSPPGVDLSGESRPDRGLRSEERRVG